MILYFAYVIYFFFFYLPQFSFFPISPNPLYSFSFLYFWMYILRNYLSLNFSQEIMKRERHTQNWFVIAILFTKVRIDIQIDKVRYIVAISFRKLKQTHKQANTQVATKPVPCNEIHSSAR